MSKLEKFKEHDTNKPMSVIDALSKSEDESTNAPNDAPTHQDTKAPETDKYGYWYSKPSKGSKIKSIVDLTDATTDNQKIHRQSIRLRMDQHVNIKRFQHMFFEKYLKEASYSKIIESAIDESLPKMFKELQKQLDTD